MPIPSYDQFIDPLLRYLGQFPQGASTRQVYAAMAQALGLTEADCGELLPSGTQPIYQNRVGWAHDRLKRAGYSSSPKRGQWQLTPQGQTFLQSHPEPLSPQEVDHLAKGNVTVRLKPADPSDDPAETPDTAAASLEDPGVIQQSPLEQLEEALGEINQSVATELLESIGQSSPLFFEILVLDLLNAMGYGTSRRDIQHVGGSGDGGIDGVISLDRLGLEKVYIQAKRWQKNVGRPEVQAFYGALAGQRANKGVFITTSDFTSQAIEFARSVEGVILVNGARLTLLMIEYGIGISHKIIRVPKLDSDYFEV